jgi:hypothetical protein
MADLDHGAVLPSFAKNGKSRAMRCVSLAFAYLIPTAAGGPGKVVVR